MAAERLLKKGRGSMSGATSERILVRQVGCFATPVGGWGSIIGVTCFVWAHIVSTRFQLVRAS